MSCDTATQKRQNDVFVHLKFPYFHKLYRNGRGTACAVYSLVWVMISLTRASYLLWQPINGSIRRICLKRIKWEWWRWEQTRFMCIHATQRRQNTIESLTLPLWAHQDSFLWMRQPFRIYANILHTQRTPQCNDKKDVQRRRTAFVSSTLQFVNLWHFSDLLLPFRMSPSQRQSLLKNVLQFTRRPTQFI